MLVNFSGTTQLASGFGCAGERMAEGGQAGTRYPQRRRTGRDQRVPLTGMTPRWGV
jgi:hypothetical protein